MSIRVKVTGDLFHGRIPDGCVYVGRQAPGLYKSRGTPIINTTETSPPCWRKAVPAALPGPLALPGDEPVL